MCSRIGSRYLDNEMVKVKTMRHTLFFMAMVFGFQETAFAYIDPGSGSAILSVIIGFFVALGLAVKTYWYKLKSFFLRKNVKDPKQDDQD